ncbi:MAG: nickel/cobalt transporter [Hyphomicrobiales bacterium]|nr:nickel/cobalt transporter [Hyphomicrobiales bacterium]
MRRMSAFLRRLLPALLGLFAAPTAFAQMTHRPFEVGGGEGGGGASGGLTGWLLAEQSQLTHLIAIQVKALHAGPAAAWALIGLGFVYGVFHAAGPGHGKAVIASYMMANDRALRRGIALAFLAALLQGAVAVALVGIAALVFNATSIEMNAAADWLALASYAGIIGIGAWLVWTKGRALLEAVHGALAQRAAIGGGSLYAGAPWRPGLAATGGTTFSAYAPGEIAVIDPDQCGHLHAPDPRALGEGFSWRAAAATVAAAGFRPCSGAILVLVFSLAQGLFAAGVAATFAMSLGTAITTGALACAAVFAKKIAMRLAAGETSRLALVARSCEFVAALAVLAFGLGLLIGAQGGA